MSTEVNWYARNRGFAGTGARRRRRRPWWAVVESGERVDRRRARGRAPREKGGPPYGSVLGNLVRRCDARPARPNRLGRRVPRRRHRGVCAVRIPRSGRAPGFQGVCGLRPSRHRPDREVLLSAARVCRRRVRCRRRRPAVRRGRGLLRGGRAGRPRHGLGGPDRGGANPAARRVRALPAARQAGREHLSSVRPCRGGGGDRRRRGSRPFRMPASPVPARGNPPRRRPPLRARRATAGPCASGSTPSGTAVRVRRRSLAPSVPPFPQGSRRRLRPRGLRTRGGTARAGRAATRGRSAAGAGRTAPSPGLPPTSTSRRRARPAASGRNVSL